MRWMGSMEELGFNKGLLYDNEVGGWHVSGVSRTLITELSFRDGSLEFLV